MRILHFKILSASKPSNITLTELFGVELNKDGSFSLRTVFGTYIGLDEKDGKKANPVLVAKSVIAGPSHSFLLNIKVLQILYHVLLHNINSIDFHSRATVFFEAGAIELRDHLQ